MSNYQFNYIITIHNKEDMLSEVLHGVIKSCSDSSVIYPVLDGCTDNSEKIVDTIADEFPHLTIKKIYAPDVHEIKSLNIALKTIPQEGRVLNITLQDDVILNDPDLEAKVAKIYDNIGFDKIGTLSFRHGVNLQLDHKNKMVREMDITESAYGTGMSNIPIPPNFLVERMVSVRSPECISNHIIKNIGILDEALAPYMWDNHDLSLRCLEAGYRNFVFALPFISDAKWGGMKKSTHPNVTKVDLRNRQYLYDKHFEFLKTFSKETNHYRLRVAKPLSIQGIYSDKTKDIDTVNAYTKRRKAMLGSSVRFIYIDVFKKSIRAMQYLFFKFKIILS